MMERCDIRWIKLTHRFRPWQVVRPCQTCLVCGDHWSWIGIIFGICFCGPLTCCIRLIRHGQEKQQLDLAFEWIRSISWKPTGSKASKASEDPAILSQMKKVAFMPCVNSPIRRLQAALLLIFQVPCSTSPAYRRGRSSSTSTSLGPWCWNWWYTQLHTQYVFSRGQHQTLSHLWIHFCTVELLNLRTFNIFQYLSISFNIFQSQKACLTHALYCITSQKMALQWHHARCVISLPNFAPRSSQTPYRNLK